MPRSFVYLIYNLLLPAVLLLGLPSFVFKGIRRGGLARNFRQRLGFFRHETLARFGDSKPIWIHAVSVGEVFVALKIVEALRTTEPGRRLVLSTTTTTGFAVASETGPSELTVIHNPVDLPFVTSRVIRLVDPAQLILVEAEIWPNLVRNLKRRGVPVKLVNARLSPRSENRYLKFLPLVEPVFSMLDAVAVPFEIDRDRWAGLGVPRDRIAVLGSVKFDSGRASETADGQIAELREWLAETGLPSDSRIVLAGSTHEGEETLVARVCGELREEFPSLALVVVPRHAERGAAIADQLRAAGFDPVLRKAPGGVVPHRVESTARQGSVHEGSAPSASVNRVRIANTTGELRSWFHLAEVVVIGKSFRAEGGQNPVEPILAGKPVVVGPNMQNFAEVVGDLKRAEGIRQLGDETELADALGELLRQPDAGLEMARRGAEIMARHEGAAERTADFVLAETSEPEVSR
ncbi:MAG: glycosyltransferase N-terminal domain-containing protein [Verrucomicrobiales bacterium]